MNKRISSHQKKLLYTLISASLFWHYPPIVHAATQADEPLSTADSSADQGEFALEEIQVTASREHSAALPPPYSGGQVARGSRAGILGNKDFMDTPFNISSYTAELIENQQANTIADVLVNNPSVRATSTSSYNEFWTIRGFSVTDTSFNGLYGVTPKYLTSTDFVERVEVLTGPSALINGMAGTSGNIGGSINLVPKRAGEEPLTRLTTTYSDDSQLGGHIDIGRRFGEKKQFGVRFNGSYSSGNTTFDNESQKVRTASLGLDWRTDRARTSLDLGYQKQHIDAPTTFLSLAPSVSIPKSPASDLNFTPAWAYADSKDTFGVLHSEFDLNKDWMFFASAGGRRNSTDDMGATATLTNNLGDLTTNILNFPMEYNSHTEELGIRGRFTTGSIQHQLTLSNTRYHMDNYYLYEVVTSFSSNLYKPSWPGRQSFSNLGKLPRDSSITLSGIAVTDTLSTPDERLQLILGARRQQVQVDNFDSTGLKTSSYDKSATSPGVGLVFKIKNNLSFYGNYIEALQQGPTAPIGAVNVGEVFAPYKAKQSEIGLKLDGGIFATTLSAFQIKQPSGLTDPDTLIYDMVGEQRNRGLELNIFGEPVKGTRLLGGIMLLDGKMVHTTNGTYDGNTPVGVSRLTATLGAEWDTPFQPNLTLTARAVYNGSQYLDSANTLKVSPWTRLDVGARYTFKHNGTPVTLRATVTNVLNKRYWMGITRGALVVGAPRTLTLSATVDF